MKQIDLVNIQTLVCEDHSFIRFRVETITEYIIKFASWCLICYIPHGFYMTERVNPMDPASISKDLVIKDSELPVTRTPRTFSRRQFWELMAAGLIRPNKAALVTLARFGGAIESAATAAPVQQFAVRVAGELVNASINPQDNSKIEVELFDYEWNRYVEHLEERFKKLEAQSGGLTKEEEEMVRASLSSNWDEAMEGAWGNLKEEILDPAKRDRARQEIEEQNRKYEVALAEWKSLDLHEKRRRQALLLQDPESRQIMGAFRALVGDLGDDIQSSVWLNYQTRLSEETSSK